MSAQAPGLCFTPALPPQSGGCQDGDRSDFDPPVAKRCTGPGYSAQGTESGRNKNIWLSVG